MPRKPPGAKAKGLGAELRALREARDLSLSAAAAPIGLSKTILSRLETGQRNISPDEVAGLLAVYGVTGSDRDRLLAMARTAGEAGWWELGIPGLTPDSATLADYEATASEIVSWAPLLIPGLLQTMPYARAFLECYSLPADVIEARVTARLRRQQTMWRPDVSYAAYIGETALRSVVGDRRVMRSQLLALLEAGRRDNITLRVVPTANGSHLGQLGAFLLLGFPAAPTVVHVEMVASGVFHDQPALTDPYVLAVAQLQNVALSETESARIVSGIADELESR